MYICICVRVYSYGHVVRVGFRHRFCRTSWISPVKLAAFEGVGSLSTSLMSFGESQPFKMSILFYQAIVGNFTLIEVGFCYFIFFVFFG